MSLGRLLRRASSKASDLLTLNPGGSGTSSSILDGEIIYSKNNVCVHPPELLQGLGEHHPGYLCLYMEKDELLGTTLILAWVPNSRIQRQDEEALRYVTPESSPVRKAPRKRGRHAQGLGAAQQASPTEPKGGVVLKEDILTVSQLVKDGAYVSSPSLDGEKLPQSCVAADGAHQSPQPARSDSGILSTISSQDEQNRSELSLEEGLDCRPEPGEDEGSLELFADDVSRDSTFDSDSDAFSSPFCLSPISEALVKSSSSVFLDNESSVLHHSRLLLAMSASGPGSGSTWFEKCRWYLEQCLDTGDGCRDACDDHMPRSHCCTESPNGSTQSPESSGRAQGEEQQKLVVASRESQYKIFHFHHGGLDKVSEVFQQWKYCTETHLKEQQLADEKTCMQFSIRRPKLPSSETHPEENTYRRLDVSAWLGHLNHCGQVEEEYKLQKVMLKGMKVACGAWLEVLVGTQSAAVWPFLLRYYSYESTSEEREALRVQKRKEYFEIQEKRRILLNYAVFNPAIGYSQGMSDLVAPILAEVLDESDTFWCFVGLMQNTIFISSPRDEDMEKQLMYLRELLRLMHPRFYQHLSALGEDGLQMLFCHRWILLCFKREFPDAEALRMWEACWAHYQTDYFHLFICVAIVVIYGDDVIEQQLATDQMLLHFGNLAMHMNGELVLRKARSLLYQFHLLPRIPCSLHDLCQLCGTGMWDSGFIPAVECSGHHPAAEGCPYGGLVEESSPKAGGEGRRGMKAHDIFNFRK
ncbi:hypothetical protein CIB84_004788 [Bambusicola thoracicus]|uniref:Rab-GAP TBC domain-containing protein n=1 Tax=Bambusicola thoracicus TaxID=9083 RepID=A0A2P4T525_BAMTH|nr:hypothetical protein CIB84_004788 [Bambusicola thoracicus]